VLCSCPAGILGPAHRLVIPGLLFEISLLDSLVCVHSMVCSVKTLHAGRVAVLLLHVATALC